MIEKNSIETLSDIVVYNKYAKYLPNVKRRETWTEIVTRYLTMMEKRYPQLKEDIWNYGSAILDKKVLPSMRALQFAGAAIERNNARLYNCSYMPMDDYRAFSEAMFLLLSGCGVGYSVQFKHIDKLPEIQKPIGDYKYLIGDNIEGWADAVRHLMASYLGYRKTKPRFDFSDIRPKGERLVTSGGKAPGPEPLKRCLFEIEQILENKSNGDKLKSIEIHSIMCHIANAVLAGGIRRSAMIALFSADDKDMLHAKSGNWWETNPHFGRANNSAVLLRHRVSKEFFMDLWKTIEDSNAGEPGFMFTNNADYGTNPCAEISLLHNCFCNLTEINFSTVQDQDDFNYRCEVATFFGTLQAGFTDFHYLRPVWRRQAEKEALLGVSLTGQATHFIDKIDLKQGAEVCKKINEVYAEAIGINKAARIGTTKPSGTASLVLGCSSGIHAWHDKYYIRRMQIIKSEDLYKYLHSINPDIVPDYEAIPNTAVLEIPVKAPEGAITRESEDAIQLLERVKRIHSEWIQPSHRKGDNTHNVSATISINKNRHYGYAEGKYYPGFKEDKGYTCDEWQVVGEWMWEYRNEYTALSVLPYDGGTYKQAPFESITEAKYNELISKFPTNIDLTQIIDIEDTTKVQDEVACGADGCEIV